MSLIKDTIMFFDPGTSSTLELGLGINDKIKNFEIKLTNNRSVLVENLLKNGPLILVFIRGTWCPFCRMHMARLNKWLQQRESTKKGMRIVISSEPAEKINKWLENNPMSLIFASDENFELSKYFGVKIPKKDNSQAATFLIDVDKTIRLAYKGKRNTQNFSELEKVLE